MSSSTLTGLILKGFLPDDSSGNGTPVRTAPAPTPSEEYEKEQAIMSTRKGARRRRGRESNILAGRLSSQEGKTVLG